MALARADGRAVVAVAVDDDLELAGVNDRVQLATVEADLRWRILETHMLAGVTMQDPTTVYVDAGVSWRAMSCWSPTSSCAAPPPSGRGASSGPAAR